MKNGGDFLLNQSGVSLIELLISVALSAVLLGFTTVYFLNFMKDDQRRRLQLSQDELIYSLQVTASSKFALQKSLDKPGNDLFKKCVVGGGCTSFTNSYNPVSLYSFDSSPVSGPGFPSSAASQPVWFDENGAPCTPGAKLCAYGVESGFRAQCRPPANSITPAATCVGPAEIVQILYKITYTGNSAMRLPAKIITKRGSPVETSELAP